MNGIYEKCTKEEMNQCQRSPTSRVVYHLCFMLRMT